MASGIDTTIDKVYSNEGTEWHRVAKHTHIITRSAVEEILWPIVETPAQGTIDGVTFENPDHKILWADMRTIRTDLPENKRVVPLHSPKSGYQVITNAQVWDMVEETIKDMGATITSVGTLERGKKFFLSVSMGDSDMIINKDQYKFFLNIVTSHDGSINLFLYDSSLRIVCMNTLRWSMNDRNIGDLQLRISHKKNAGLAIKNLPDVVNSVLKGRIEFKEVMEYLATCKVDQNDAIAMCAGYFADPKEQKLSTQGFNATSEIINLFYTGIECHGETAYDLVNAATEYWTSGKGTGSKDSTLESRTYRSAIGSASDHKSDFVNMLANDNLRNDALLLGREAYKKFCMDEKNSTKVLI
jgi:hypothetical protein